MDRFLPLVTGEIRKVTGLPVTIEHLDISLLPMPSVDAQGVSLGAGDFAGAADRVSARLRVRGLLRGAVEITNVKLSGLEVTLPGDPVMLAERIEALNKALGKTSGGKRAIEISVERIHARGAAVRLAEDTRPVPAESFAICDIELRDVLTDQISCNLRARVPGWGESSIVEAEMLMLPPSDDAELDVSGWARLWGVELARALNDPRAPDLLVEATARFEHATGLKAAAELSGSLGLAEGAPRWAEALVGDFTGTAWWADGEIIVNDLEWTGRGGRLKGDTTRYKDGTFGFHIREAAFNAAGLDPLLATVELQGFSLKPQAAAKAEVRDILVASDGQGPPRLVRGVAEVSGVDLVLEDGATILEGMGGSGKVEENVFSIEYAGAQGVSLAGTLRPDFVAGNVVVDLSGQVELTRERVAAFLDLGPIEELAGTVRLERVAATVIPGEGLPNDIVIEGALTDGRVAVVTPKFSYGLTSVACRFAGDAKTMRTTAGAKSEQLGTVALEGRYEFDSGTWKGTVDVDVSSFTLPIPTEGVMAKLANALLAEYGASRFEVVLSLPTPDAEYLGARLLRQGDPALSGQLTVVPEDEGWTIGAVNATAAVPLRTLRAVVSDEATFEGDSIVTFERRHREDQFTLQSDLTPCTVSMGDTIRKKIGDSLTVSLTGSVSDEEWSPRTFTISYLDQDVRGRFDGGRFVVDSLDLDVAPLAGLLPEGARVSGRLTGSIAAMPAELDLELHDVAFALMDAAAIDAINGRITYRGGGWTCDGLTVRGANSECTLNAGWDGSKWRGRLAGRQFDLNAFEAAWNTAKAFRKTYEQHEAGRPGEAASPKDTMVGELTVDLDHVYYRRGRLDDLHAHVVATDDAIEIRDVSVRPYTGSAHGTVDIARSMGQAPPVVKVNIKFEQIDARIIDELVFPEPRNIRGAMDGTVILSFPFEAGVNPLQHATGAIEFRGRNGSFGKLGLTTKLLTVLRATEVIRLRMPKIKDEGLAYDACQGVCTIENGFMTVRAFVAENPTLRLSGQGTVDFKKNQANLAFEATLLGGVSDLIEVVGLDKAAENVRELGKFHLTATGPPEDPKIELAQGAAFERIKETVESGEQGLRDVLKEAAGRALRGILRK